MNNLTLASVEEAFKRWRDGRYSRAEPIPEALWSMALGLYPQYKRSRICHLLHLSGAQFKRRLEDGGDTRVNSGFVMASRDDVKMTPVVASTEIQLTLQGQLRSMTLCFDAHALGHVLSHVGALL
jgi:hypothetical protein